MLIDHTPARRAGAGTRQARPHRATTATTAAITALAIVASWSIAPSPPADAITIAGPQPRTPSFAVAWHEIGRSVQGRPLRATTVGTGPRRVLWIGGIHGNEQEGAVATAAIIQAFADPLLATAATLTVLEDANPDGRAANTRTNAHGVDLNRNFPTSNFAPAPDHGWTPLSEPESRAVQGVLHATRPELVIVMHSWSGRQFIDYNGPGASIAARFSAKSGMPVQVLSPAEAPGGLGLYTAEALGVPALTVEFARGLAQDRAWQMIREAAIDVIGTIALPSSGPVAVNRDGRFETFAVSTGGTLLNAFQYAVGQGWSGWYPHPGAWPPGRQVATMRSASGRLEVFGTAEDGTLMRSVQLAIGLGWSLPAPIGAYLASRPVVGRNLDGRIEVVALGLDLQLWHTWEQRPGGPWAGWAPFGGSFGAAPAIGATADGRLVVAAVATDGTLRATAQIAPNGSWTPLLSIPTPAPLSGTPAIARNRDGRLEIIAVGGGLLQHATQAGLSWSTVQPLSPTPVTDVAPAVGRNPDGRLEVVFLDATGRLGHLWQHWPGGPWSTTYTFGDRAMTMSPSIATNGDGRMEAFALGDDGHLWHTYQYVPGGAWSPLYSLGGDLSSG